MLVDKNYGYTRVGSEENIELLNDKVEEKLSKLSFRQLKGNNLCGTRFKDLDVQVFFCSFFFILSIASLSLTFYCFFFEGSNILGSLSVCLFLFSFVFFILSVMEYKKSKNVEMRMQRDELVSYMV